MNHYIFDIEQILEKWEMNLLILLPKIMEAMISLLVFYILAKLVKYIARIMTKTHPISSVIVNAIYFSCLFLGIFLSLDLLGLGSVLSNLLAGAGIVGIIAGFAFKDVASNIFSGMLLKMHEPYKHGDWVEMDGAYGKILDIGWLTTDIETITGQETSVPNQIIYSGIFTNYSTWGKRRVVIQSGVSFGDDLDLVKNVAIEEIKQIENILENEEVDFFFTEIGASSFNFIVRFWIKFEDNDDFIKPNTKQL